MEFGCLLYVLFMHFAFSIVVNDGPMEEAPLPPSPLPSFSPLPHALTNVLNTLAALHRKPTCYRGAAMSLIHYCKSLSGDIPDPDRVQFAIKLTICELDLIQQTPDLCRTGSRWNDCVKVLAMEDHWWTTFSGNLREVTNVCWIGRREVEKDELLELHSNLTSVQARLLEILRKEADTAEMRERDRRVVEQSWNAFTTSLEESLWVLSVNTSILTRDLLSALLRLQTFTTHSTDVVAEQISVLERDIRSVREQIGQVRIDVDTIIADVTQEHLFTIENGLDAIRVDALTPLAKQIDEMHFGMTSSLNVANKLALHLNEGLSRYLNFSESAAKTLKAELQGANDLAHAHIDRLETGFEKLNRALDFTEERMISWNKDIRLSVFSGLIGFIVGSSAGWSRWALIVILGLWATSRIPEISDEITSVAVRSTSLLMGSFLVIRRIYWRARDYIEQELEKTEQLLPRRRSRNLPVPTDVPHFPNSSYPRSGSFRVDE